MRERSAHWDAVRSTASNGTYTAVSADGPEKIPQSM
jgi:hypothetical protein